VKKKFQFVYNPFILIVLCLLNMHHDNIIKHDTSTATAEATIKVVADLLFASFFRPFCFSSRGTSPVCRPATIRSNTFSNKLTSSKNKKSKSIHLHPPLEKTCGTIFAFIQRRQKSHRITRVGPINIISISLHSLKKNKNT
jgi:hypothetical protein